MTILRKTPSTVEWDDHDYPAHTGIDILVRTMSDPVVSASRRALALERLAPLGPLLKDTEHVPILIGLYEVLTDTREKMSLVGCLGVSDDSRALPTFVRVLDGEKDIVVRFQAAYALARWNVRRGVTEIVELLQSPDVGPQGQRFADELVKVFQSLNRQKGWGFPDLVVLRRIADNQSGSNEEEKRAMYVAEIKRWFSENQHRFPEWKADDPLPGARGEMLRRESNENPTKDDPERRE